MKNTNSYVDWQERGSKQTISEVSSPLSDVLIKQLFSQRRSALDVDMHVKCNKINYKTLNK